MEKVDNVPWVFGPWGEKNTEAVCRKKSNVKKEALLVSTEGLTFVFSIETSGEMAV